MLADMMQDAHVWVENHSGYIFVGLLVLGFFWMLKKWFDSY